MNTLHYQGLLKNWEGKILKKNEIPVSSEPQSDGRNKTNFLSTGWS